MNKKTEKKLLIIYYHQIINSDFDTKIHKSPFAVTLNQIKNQFEIIQRSRIPVVSLESWYNEKFNGNLAIHLTFDDANQSDYTLALPLLKEFNFTASFYPYLNAIDNPNKLSWQQLKEIRLNQFEIGSHGISHTPLINQKLNEIKAEIRDSKEKIEQNMQQPITIFAIPYGLYSNKITSEIAIYYNTVLTTKTKINSHKQSKILHRWNIKSKTSPKDFERMLNGNKFFLLYKSWLSECKFNLLKFYNFIN